MLRLILTVWLSLLLASTASAERYTYLPVSDEDDGVLTDGTTWSWNPGNSTFDQILLNCGQEGGSTYATALGYAAADLTEGQSVAEARLRLNQQGGVITSGLTLQITAALDLDPLATAGAARFSLPRTSNSVFWSISAPFDSSGQRIAKWAETPDVSAILEEVVAQTGWDAGPHEVLFFFELSSATGDNVIRFDDTHSAFTGPGGGNAGIEAPRLIVSETFRDAFWGQELLCRPTPSSVEVNFIPHDLAVAYVEWGTDGVTFPNSTSQALVFGGDAEQFLLDGLTSDTQYYYRLVARSIAGSFENGPTRTFVTMPGAGQQARVAATTDIHVTNQLALAIDTQMDLLETSVAMMLEYLSPQRYHCWVDLGDLVLVRAQRICFDEEEVEQRYRTARQYIDLAAHSLPFILVRGNHEEVNGWDDDGSGMNTAVWSGKMLLKYFPTPLPNTFYSGNTIPHPDLGLPGNYFAFNAGSVRFRCLDPYLFSEVRPHNGHGEVGGSLDGWDWELGQQQYDWLLADLQLNLNTFNITALHHLTTCYSAPGYYYGRGGVEVVDYAVANRPTFEWGGEDETGADVIGTMRPGYSQGSVHDMLVANGNQVVIKGHDHFHGRQVLDGMVYQTLAKPDATEQQTGNLWGWRFFSFYPEAETIFESNSGFYSILADDTLMTMSYVQTWPVIGEGNVRDSFSITSGGGTTDVGAAGLAPGLSEIRRVAPNPARIAPRIDFVVPRESEIRLTIHDVTGRKVREVVAGTVTAGEHSAYWDRLDRAGRRVPAGVYFARLEALGRVDAVKLVVLQ